MDGTIRTEGRRNSPGRRKKARDGPSGERKVTGYGKGMTLRHRDKRYTHERKTKSAGTRKVSQRGNGVMRGRAILFVSQRVRKASVGARDTGDKGGQSLSRYQLS